MTTTSATAEIRRTLDLAFDDLALSALCMDYFPEVYNRFSQGMRKDYKIMLLLDHCRRVPDHFERLLKAVRKEETSLAKSATKAPAFSSFPPSQRAGICPFEYGSTVPPERFYGRDSQRADIKNRIGAISAQCLSIVGLRRSGKSSHLRYIRRRLHECGVPDLDIYVSLLHNLSNPSSTIPRGST